MTITGNQSKIARILCGFKTTKEVSEFLGIASNSYNNWEASSKSLAPATIAKARTFFENRGVTFIDDTSANKNNALSRTFVGQDGFRLFLDDVYEVCRSEGGEICLYNARPSNWIKWVGEEWWAEHTLRMQEALKETNYRFKVTAKTGDYNFIGGKHAEYRWVPDEFFNEQSFYIYGDRFGILSFEDDAVEIFVIYKREVADSYRKLFNIAWESVTTIPDSPDHKPECYDEE